jgi:hypothetical protein
LAEDEQRASNDDDSRQSNHSDENNNKTKDNGNNPRGIYISLSESISKFFCSIGRGRRGGFRRGRGKDFCNHSSSPSVFCS